jgi:hypothetical protein
LIASQTGFTEGNPSSPVRLWRGRRRERRSSREGDEVGEGSNQLVFLRSLCGLRVKNGLGMHRRAQRSRPTFRSVYLCDSSLFPVGRWISNSRGFTTKRDSSSDESFKNWLWLIASTTGFRGPANRRLIPCGPIPWSVLRLGLEAEACLHATVATKVAPTRYGFDRPSSNASGFCPFPRLRSADAQEPRPGDDQSKGDTESFARWRNPFVVTSLVQSGARSCSNPSKQ